MSCSARPSSATSSARVPVLQNAVRAGLAGLFGPPPVDPHAHPGDPGLFGPGSASWQVLAEPAAIVGGIRALLVQLLHPLAMAGVAQHSSFREAPLERLRNTAAYVTTTAFGSTAEALAVAARVRAVHRRVRGTATDGTAYTAEEPHLLTWVSISLTSSFLASDRNLSPTPVGPATADAFVAEQARAAALLDWRVDLDALATDQAAVDALREGSLELPMLADGTLPTTAAQLRDAQHRYSHELALTPEARDALRFLLWPSIPATAMAGYLPLLAGAVATLEPAERRLLGLHGPQLAYVPSLMGARALVAVLRATAGRSRALAIANERVHRR